MATVDVLPKVRCDNCGKTVDKIPAGGKDLFSPPKRWGCLQIIGGDKHDAYGGVQRMEFHDLCPGCVQAAMDAADAALKPLRGE